jgi:hypothetical protein
MSDEAINSVASAFDASMQPEAPAKPAKVTPKAPTDTPPQEPEERLFVQGDDEGDDDDENGLSETHEDGEPGEDGEDEGGEDDEGGDEVVEDSSDLPLGSKVRVTVDGEPVEVTVKEALEGYIRTQTFHKRLNEVNEAKKTVEKEQGEVTQARGVYADMLQTLASQLDALTPPEPEWDKEFAADPVGAIQKQRLWDKFKEQRYAVDQERKRVDAETQHENTKKLSQYVESERKLLAEKNPQWTDPTNGQKNWERDRAAMDKTARACGFTDAEINNILDHRMISILHKAAQYDRIRAAKPQPVINNGKKPTRPGSGNIGTGQRGMSREANRLARTGSISDATALFQRVLQSE